MHQSWERIVAFWRTYEHHIGVMALAVGFLFDLALAKRPDSIANNVLLVSYLFIAGVVIVILNTRAARGRAENSEEPLFLLLILQFCFGGLASNLLVLYGHSGTVGGSFLFLLFLIALVFGNEFLRSRYAVLRFNIGVYYVLLLSYILVAFPIFVTHSIGSLVFLLSATASMVAMVPFFIALRAALRGRGTTRLLWEARAIVASLALVFTAAYFLNIIPPVPLSLKTVGVYHSVVSNSAGGYVLSYEIPEWFVFWRDTSSIYTRSPWESAFCFSTIYAPASFGAAVYHEWSYYNTSSGRWEERFRALVPVHSAPGDTHRAWSKVNVPQTGEWRCDVKTAQGALIGRISFIVVSGSNPALSTITL